MLDGLIMRRMICKARSFEKLAGMIDADRMPIGHVSDSLQFGRIFHQMITSVNLENVLPQGARRHENAVVRVESHDFSFFEALDLSELRLRCIGGQLCKRTRAAVSDGVQDVYIRPSAPALYDL